LGRVLRRPSFISTPAAAVRFALGDLADALILGGQRVVPARVLALGYEFRYPSLEPALRAIYDR
jgi:NAD dependent epimerase/dehydratase family enzyme